MSFLLNPFRFTVPGFEPEADTVLAAFSVEPSGARKNLINDLVVALKGAGVWARLDALYIMAAHDAQAARINWIDPGTFDLTLHGTSNPSFTTDQYVETNGIDNYLSTNFNPVTAGGNYTRDSACFGVWSGTSAGTADWCAGWFDGTNGTMLFTRNSSTDFANTRVNQGANTTSINGTIPDGSGLLVANRSGSALQQIYKDGVALSLSGTAGVRTSTAMVSANFRLGSITATRFQALKFRAGVIGQSLNATEQADLHAALSTYITAVVA